MKTPDQVLSDKEAEQAALEPAPSPARAKAAPTPAPVAEEVSVPEPAPAAPAAPPAPAAGKRAVAQEVAAATAAVTAEIEQKLTEDADTYQFPPITLLQESREENYAETGAELRNNSRRLAETLTSFGVDATAGDVVHGPSVTRYEFVLDQGVKLSKITNLSDDIALALGASGVRIAPIPDKISVVGIEVPNKQVTPVLIRDVIESREFTEHKSKVAFALGKGYRRPEHRGGYRASAPRADRRHHRLRQVRVHQLPDCVACCTSPPRMRSALSWWIPRWWSWPPTTAFPTC